MASQQPSTHDGHVLLSGLGIGESPRWHEDRLWFSNWGTEEIVAVDLDGTSEVVGQSTSPRTAVCRTDGCGPTSEAPATATASASTPRARSGRRCETTPALGSAKVARSCNG
jgi:sugar lactone lactonase YvrE